MHIPHMLTGPRAPHPTLDRGPHSPLQEGGHRGTRGQGFLEASCFPAMFNHKDERAEVTAGHTVRNRKYSCQQTLQGDPHSPHTLSLHSAKPKEEGGHREEPHFYRLPNSTESTSLRPCCRWPRSKLPRSVAT